MHVILDHLAAVIISSVILLVLALVQVRGTQSNTEATMNHIVYSEALNINEFLERDIENMLTVDQTNAAIAAGKMIGAGAWSCQITNATGNLTQAFTFPTLNPDSTLDPTDPSAIQVTYTLTATGDSALVPINGTLVNSPLFRLRRMINTDVTGLSMGIVSHFLVEAANRGVPGYPTISGACPANMSKVRFEYKLAADPVEFATTNQRNTNQLNVSRFGSTVSLTNWD